MVVFETYNTLVWFALWFALVSLLSALTGFLISHLKEEQHESKEKDMSNLDKMLVNFLEFAAVTLLALLIEIAVSNSLFSAGLNGGFSVIGGWIAFFVFLFVYYKLIHAYIRVER